jgi:hypothetical protein
VHSSKDDRPVFRDWAKSEAAALEKLEAVKRRDAHQPDDDYWVTELTENQVRDFIRVGAIPSDA